MFGFIGPQHMPIIIILLILLFGAKKLPELARGMGKSLGEFKKGREESERELSQSIAQSGTDTKPKDPAAK